MGFCNLRIPIWQLRVNDIRALFVIRISQREPKEKWRIQSRSSRASFVKFSFRKSTILQDHHVVYRYLDTCIYICIWIISHAYLLLKTYSSYGIPQNFLNRSKRTRDDCSRETLSKNAVLRNTSIT